MSRPLTAAVAGTGFIGPVHVEGLQRAGVRVLGMVGSSPQKGREASERLGLPTSYDSLDDAIRDPNVDVIHLATPNQFHFQQASSALRAGKHVICEKPLAMNSQESMELTRIAAGSGKVAGVAYNIRFYPLCHEAAARIRNGGIGEIFHAVGSYVQDWLLYPTDFNWRVLAKDGGELRAVADIGTHWLDLIQFITGKKIVSVCADLRTVHETRQRPRGGVETFSGKGKTVKETEPISISTDDSGCVMLRFENGANGCLWVSQTTAGKKNCLRFEIGGSLQSLAWNSEVPNELWIGERDRPNQLLVRDPALLSDSARHISNYPGGHNEGFPDSFKQLFRSFYGYVQANDLSVPCPFPTFEDGHREILLCEAILQSHRSRSWVDVRQI